MSGSTINSKIQKVFGKVANKIGYQFEVYRSLDYLNPIQTKNFIGYVNAGYSLDDAFEKQKSYSFSLYNLWVDTTNYRPGDIFVNQDKTFTLVANDPIATPSAICSISKLSIYRPTYNATGGFSAKRSQVYTNIPAQIISTSSSSNQGNAAGFTQIKNPIQEWDIWVWLPEGSIKPRDIIVDDAGNDMVITSIEPAGNMGYQLHTMTTKL